MSLMDRIKIKHFLSFSPSEKLSLIQRVRLLRHNAIIEAKFAKETKATKSKARGKRKPQDPGIAAIKLLDKLNPAQLKRILEGLKV